MILMAQTAPRQAMLKEKVIRGELTNSCAVPCLFLHQGITPLSVSYVNNITVDIIVIYLFIHVENGMIHSAQKLGFLKQ